MGHLDPNRTELEHQSLPFPHANQIPTHRKFIRYTCRRFDDFILPRVSLKNIFAIIQWNTHVEIEICFPNIRIIFIFRWYSDDTRIFFRCQWNFHKSIKCDLYFGYYNNTKLEEGILHKVLHIPLERVNARSTLDLSDLVHDARSRTGFRCRLRKACWATAHSRPPNAYTIDHGKRGKECPVLVTFVLVFSPILTTAYSE